MGEAECERFRQGLGLGVPGPAAPKLEPQGF
jgi:hypothetical protein